MNVLAEFIKAVQGEVALVKLDSGFPETTLPRRILQTQEFLNPNGSLTYAIQLCRTSAFDEPTWIFIPDFYLKEYLKCGGDRNKYLLTDLYQRYEIR